MREIAAAPRDDLHWTAEPGLAETAHHHVVERRTAGGQQHLAFGEQPFAIALTRDLQKEIEETADLRFRLGRRRRREKPLETLDTAQSEVGRRRLDRPRHSERRSDVARAGASAGETAFEQHLKRAAGGGRAGRLGEQRDTAFGIDEAVEVEPGIAPQLVEYVADS